MSVGATCLDSNAFAVILATSSTDRLLAILEAAARSLPPYTALLEEAKDSEDPMVQWNAVRLLEGLKVASEIELR